MRRGFSVLLPLAVLTLCPDLTLAGPQEPAAKPAPARAAQGPSAGAPATERPLRHSEEITIESASKLETTLVNAPATLSVVTAQALETTPAQSYADLLRSVPGMNAIQTSARDVNLTTRQATSTLNNSELVLVDGRSVYLDFFGLVLWDFVPSPSSGEIKQIEVVRGPASVVWGANALTGVVNVITKSPRENQGLRLSLSSGLFGRAGGSREREGEGRQYGGSLSYATAIGETWSYGVSAGYASSDPYSRPLGRVPLACHPLGVTPCRDAEGHAVPGGFPVGGAAYPTESEGGGNFVNSGTSQPRFDLRVDQDLGGGGRLRYAGGYAGTQGIIHTGIGPFEIRSGSHMAYARTVYSRAALRVGAFVNLVEADAPNLLQTDPATLEPVILGFKTRTFDLELADARVVASRHVLSFGGNYRRNAFDITLAPGAADRNELGAYLQDEVFVSRLRLAAGLRADRFGNLDHWVLSPRLSLMLKPAPEHSIRFSYNRAFRSPSVINEYLDQSIFSPTPIDLRPLVPLLPPPARALVPGEPFQLVVNTTGSPTLREEHIDALELAYTGSFGRTTVGLAVYRNVTDDNINFTTLLPDGEHPEGLPGLEYYSADHPATGVGLVTRTPITLDPALMALLARAPGSPILLPYRVASYMNLGPIRNRGLEASVEHRIARRWTAFVNTSWQADPKVLAAGAGQERYPIGEVGLGPRHRFNLGTSYDGRLLLADLSLNRTGAAFWNDVLDAPYHGFSDAYTMLNATVGVKLAAGKVVFSVKGTNLLNQRILQHVYGDLMRRALVVQLRYSGE